MCGIEHVSWTSVIHRLPSGMREYTTPEELKVVSRYSKLPNQYRSAALRVRHLVLGVNGGTRWCDIIWGRPLKQLDDTITEILGSGDEFVAQHPDMVDNLHSTDGPVMFKPSSCRTRAPWFRNAALVMARLHCHSHSCLMRAHG
jgi:hypothetical protein